MITYLRGRAALGRAKVSQALLLLVLISIQVQLPAAVQSDPQAPRDLNTPREFPQVGSRKDWQQRAREIREQILVSCGLWPMPPRTPLEARIFGKIERDGYSVEKVYFQTSPGFYLGGNLYRPLGQGKGPHPAVLNPHGHWAEGRLVDNQNGSIPARCISFARQGLIAFSYDMVGYNDSHFANVEGKRSFSEIHHLFATNRTDLLWNISLMGLQTWNSIRALDFLAALPDADPRRLGCTGESGGGTQTFILGAIDDRLAVQAPVVMVSHTMQGGCLCENAPGLRIEYSNMEISAAAAPRPQLLVAATGDWTKDTLTVEGPAIARVYQRLNARDKFHYVRFNFGHNYNQTSREAVYEWFGKWLFKDREPGNLKEKPYQKEPDADLRVFPAGELPTDAMTQDQFIESLEQSHRAQWRSLVPQSKAGLRQFYRLMLPAWRHTLQLDWPVRQPQVRSDEPAEVGGFTTTTLHIKRAGSDSDILATQWAPPGLLTNRAPRLVVLCETEPAAPGAQTNPTGLARRLLQRGLAVLAVKRFSTGKSPDQFTNFYTTYNRTKLQERVADLLAVCAAARRAEAHPSHAFRVLLAGLGSAGGWALLAAPGADVVIADANQLDAEDDQSLLSPDLFCPGLRNIGTFEGAAMLAVPHPLLLHNLGKRFGTNGIFSAYQATGKLGQFRACTERLTDEEIAEEVSRL